FFLMVGDVPDLLRSAIEFGERQLRVFCRCKLLLDLRRRFLSLLRSELSRRLKTRGSSLECGVGRPFVVPHRNACLGDMLRKAVVLGESLVDSRDDSTAIPE